MKIFILDTVKPLLNAGAVHRWELIRNLAKIGHDVWVIAYSDIEIKGVHTTLLKGREGVIGKLSSRFRYVGMLFKLAMRHHFDILYTRNGLNGVIGYLLKILTGSKLVYELNGILSDEWELWKKQNKSGIFEKIEMEMSIRAEKFALKKADAVIAVIEGIKNYLVNCGINESKITVIENGANTDLFRPIDDSIALQRLRKQYNIEEEDHLVVFAGGMAPYQGIEHLIIAAPLILEKVPKTKFLIVGDGIMRKKWEDMAKEFGLNEKFIFTGRVPYKDVPKYINVGDVCISMKKPIVPGSSLKVFEYMACEKPVIATKNSSYGFEILEEENAGLLVDPEKPEDVRDAIIKLLMDKELSKKMGKNGRKVVIERYSWESTAKRVAEVCKLVIEKQ